jgi:hypothetical protein
MDTLTRPPQWWKHLRPTYKHLVSKRERQAAAKQMTKEIAEALGVPKEMYRMGSFHATDVALKCLEKRDKKAMFEFLKAIKKEKKINA